MSGFDWSAISERGPDCPSEPALERLHLGVGSATDRAHADGCADCQAFLTRLARGFEVVPDLDERVLLAGIRQRLDAQPKRAPWWRSLFLLVPVGAAAAVAFLVLRPGPAGPIEADAGVGTRMKGSFGLKVHRKTATGSELMASGDRFAPGDQLRLEVSLPGTGRLAVFGQEANGTVYKSWPFDGDSAEASEGTRSLPDAIELDDALGRERLLLVYCPPDKGQPLCRQRESGIECPPGCLTARFELDKQR